MNQTETIENLLTRLNVNIKNTYGFFNWNIQQDEECQSNLEHFFEDFEDYSKLDSKKSRNYYLGHFIFKTNGDKSISILDGKQRIISALAIILTLLKMISQKRELSKKEQLIQNQLNKGIANSISDSISIEAQLKLINLLHKSGVYTAFKSKQNLLKSLRLLSAKISQYKRFDETNLTRILNTVLNSTYTSCIAENETEAQIMFSNHSMAGKQKSAIDVLQALCIKKAVHTEGKEAREMFHKIGIKFNCIWDMYSAIDEYIHADDVLRYAFQVHENSLIYDYYLKDNFVPITKELIDFVDAIVDALNCLVKFFLHDQEKSEATHSMVAFGSYEVALPFIIKGYLFKLPENEMDVLIALLGRIVARHEILEEEKGLNQALSSEFSNFTMENPSVYPIVKRIKNLLESTSDKNKSYWNNAVFEKQLRGELFYKFPKFLLWKYENHLLKEAGNKNTIIPFHQFKEYTNITISRLTGNTLLSRETDYTCTIGDQVLIKRKQYFEPVDLVISFRDLLQQEEVLQLTRNGKDWDIEYIKEREDKIIEVIMKLI